MTPTALDIGLALSAAQARLSFALDDALGTLHGIGLRELGLLVQLQRSPQGAASLDALSVALGLPPSSLLRLCLPLVKTGLIERAPRRLGLRPAGARLAAEAAATAEAAAQRLLPAEASPGRAALDHLLCAVAARPAPAGTEAVAR